MKKYYLPLIALSMIFIGVFGLNFIANGSCH